MAKRDYGRAGRIGHAWPLILVLLILIACGSVMAVQSRWISKSIGVQHSPKITRLIYPTYGNPAIVKKGESLTIEYDPRSQVYWRFLPVPMSFQVEVKTSNGPAILTRPLDVRSVEIGYSTRWPEYARSSTTDRRIYLVTVAVPPDLPCDLYDVHIESQFVLFKHKDMQPHALQAIDEYKDRFSFVQMTDVHVWGHEIYYPSCTYHERSDRPNGKDPNRKGAVYYQKAIDQVNLIHPDFVIFSGDALFGQRYFTQDNGPPWGETTEYQYEMMWFYEETLRLDVPCFMVMGNHDSYNEGDEAAGEDWFINWRKLYGPIYRSFDYDDCHFVACNSQDWSPAQRELIDWFDVMLQPTKYKGQFAAGGDAAAAGITAERMNGIDIASLKGQLAWIRDDLAGHQDSRARILVMHHDPYKTDGSGEMWGTEAGKGGIAGLKHALTSFLDMGNGQGRLAIMKLMQEYRVAMEISGHDHSDYVATRSMAQKALGQSFYDVFTWKDGAGEVKYVNSTSIQFPEEGESDRYPGYRWIWIDNGRVESFNYKDPKWSYPSYEGTNVGGTTDLDKLVTPAIRSRAQVASDGGSATITVENSLDVGLPAAYVEVRMPALPYGYQYEVQNGTLLGSYPADDGKGGVVCQVAVPAAPNAATTASVVKGEARSINPPPATGPE